MSKIESRNRTILGQVERVQAAPQTEPPAGKKKLSPGAADRVELTIDRDTLAALTEQAMKLPAERTDRMQELRNAIENGTYAPDLRAVAKKLLESWSV